MAQRMLEDSEAHRRCATINYYSLLLQMPCVEIESHLPLFVVMSEGKQSRRIHVNRHCGRAKLLTRATSEMPRY